MMKQVVKWIAEGAVKSAMISHRVFCDVWAYISCRGYVSILLSVQRRCCAWPIGWTVAALLSLMFYKTGTWNMQEKKSHKKLKKVVDKYFWQVYYPTRKGKGVFEIKFSETFFTFKT